MTTGEGFKGRVQQKSSTKGNGGGSSSVNGGNPRCKCGEEAKVRVSRTDANLGKAFYCCYLPKGHESNCNFFRWVDDVADTDESSGLGMKAEDSMLLKELVVKNDAMLEELSMMKEVMLKNECLIEELRTIKGVLENNVALVEEQNRFKNVELRMLRGLVCVLVMFMVIGMSFVVIRGI